MKERKKKRINCYHYFSKIMKLNIPVLTHITPMFQLGFTLLRVYSHHDDYDSVAMFCRA